MLNLFHISGMFTYNEKSRTYWFSKTCMDNDSEFNLVGVVSFLGWRALKHSCVKLLILNLLLESQNNHEIIINNNFFLNNVIAYGPGSL